MPDGTRLVQSKESWHYLITAIGLICGTCLIDTIGSGLDWSIFPHGIVNKGLTGYSRGRAVTSFAASSQFTVGSSSLTRLPLGRARAKAG